jgi:AbrB family looped-hinge helix DNA binding protein
MRRISRQPVMFSKVSVKSKTVIPREVREQLKLKPGDTLRYRVTDDGILLDKATEAGEDPFAAFSEWKSDADERPMADYSRKSFNPSWRRTGASNPRGSSAAPAGSTRPPQRP